VHDAGVFFRNHVRTDLVASLDSKVKFADDISCARFDEGAV
jgi:hypothetical protein